MAEEPVHVGSGGFRVDRRRMLEKLTKFQSSDPTEPIAAWLRAAVLGGASRIRCTAHPDAYELAFDGRPFERKHLERIYDCLFDTEADDAKRRHFLAMGLVGAFSAKPAAVSIASGKGGCRAKLLASSLLEESILEADDEGPETRIRVWGVVPPKKAELIRRLDGVRQCPVSVAVDEWTRSPVSGYGSGRLSVAVTASGTKGFVRPLFDKNESFADLLVHGVFAEKARLDLGPAAVHAEIARDDFQLDASAAKVVRDKAFQEAQNLLREASQELLVKVLTDHRKGLREAGRAMVRELRCLRAWQEVFDPATESTLSRRLTNAVTGLLAVGQSEDDRLYVVEMAETTGWLRRASLRSIKGWQDRPKKPSDKLKPAWTAPVFLDWNGRPLALLQLRECLEERGCVYWSSSPRKRDSDLHPVVWATCEKEGKALESAFRAPYLKEVTYQA